VPDAATALKDAAFLAHVQPLTLDEVALLHRKLTSTEMTTVLRNMRPQEKDALADYISRLENSEALLDLNPRDTRETLPGPISH